MDSCPVRYLDTGEFLNHQATDKEYTCRYSKELNNVVEECRVDAVVCQKDMN